MPEVLLIAPPYTDIYGKLNVEKMGFVLPPLGLAYIASFLKKHGRVVELIDAVCMENGVGELLEKIKREQPRLIGFTVVTANMSSVVKMAVEIKKVSPSSRIVVGGPHPSALPLETIRYEGIDIVAVGEGEETMLGLCETSDLSKVEGICYKDASGAVRINGPRPLLEDLDNLPFPFFEQLPVSRYGYLSLGNALPVLSARGCPHSCSFCASNVIHKRTCRFRSASGFVDELEYLKRRFGISRFVFCDDAFTLNYKRTMDICGDILRRGLNIRWSCMMRVDNTNRETLGIMKKAGCQMIEIGVESADKKVLEKCHKKINLERIARTVDMANRVKLEINAFFILGLPFDTPASIRRTIDFAKRLKIDYAQFSMFIPLPGSEAWDMVKEGSQLRCVAKDWDDFSRYKRPIVASAELPQEELYALYNRGIREFYFRPYTIWRTLRKIDSLSRLKMFLNAGLSLIGYLLKRDSGG